MKKIFFRNERVKEKHFKFMGVRAILALSSGDLSKVNTVELCIMRTRCLVNIYLYSRYARKRTIHCVIQFFLFRFSIYDINREQDYGKNSGGILGDSELRPPSHLPSLLEKTETGLIPAKSGYQTKCCKFLRIQRRAVQLLKF